MRSLPVLCVALLAAAPACTLDLGDDDDRPPPGDPEPDPPDDPDDPPPPDPMGGATRLIGTNPHVNAQATDWASVWVNYPSVDCLGVELYGADLAVVADGAFEAMLAETGLVPGSFEPFVVGWLALERESPEHLWRVTSWVPEGEPEPECYVW